MSDHYPEYDDEQDGRIYCEDCGEELERCYHCMEPHCGCNPCAPYWEPRWIHNDDDESFWIHTLFD